MFVLRKKLRESGKEESEIDAEIKSERERLMAEMQSSQKMDLRDKHQAALAKHHDIEKLGKALKISKDFEGGAAFDFEL